MDCAAGARIFIKRLESMTTGCHGSMARVNFASQTNSLNSHFYIPQEPLYKDLVQSFWQTEQDASFTNERIIPQGIIEVIFNFSRGSHIQAGLGKDQYSLPKCFINGFNTMPIDIQLTEKQELFGIMLQPMAVKKIFKIPGSEFADKVIDLTLLDKGFSSLWHQLAEQATFSKRVSVFLNWIKTHYFDTKPQEKLINQFLYSVNQHNQSVVELAGQLCYSPRQLSRKLFDATGMNTEENLLYKKYLHSVHRIHYSDESLTQIAYQSHFSDQSHFIKTFKSYAKMTPGEYRQNKGPVQGHIYENVR